MKKSTLFICLFINSYSTAIAQTLMGTVADGDTHNAIAQIAIVNRKTNLHTFTDPNGKFEIIARLFDTLVFVSDGVYEFNKISVQTITHLKLDTIFLKKKYKQLNEVVSLSGYAKFKKDSAENRKLYRKQIADAKRKPKARFNILYMRVEVDGGLTSLADNISGNKKRNKTLLKQIEKDEEVKFRAIYYNENTVKRILNLPDSAVKLFIEKYPMPYDLLRNANDIEKDIWIKKHYLEFSYKK